MTKLKIFNTLSNQLEEFIPISGNKVNLYVCGPTVYDHAHLGHARCYIVWDTVTRYLRFKGYDLTYVRNITDVDDKIIYKAKAQNLDISIITNKYISEFESDMANLNVLKPDIEPKATEYVNEMIIFTEKLINKNAAYQKNGDVFFRVANFQPYGELSNKKISDLICGSRVDVDEKKENPLDFALWKSVNNSDEPTWISPWGTGRPGWHTECCAMISKLLGDTIDIHAGGFDLVFPHHENEKAQVEAITGKPFVKYWMHNGFVNVDSEKMSKSLGNFKTIKDLTKLYDSNAIRLFVLTNHYRMPIDFKDESLNAAKNGIKKVLKAYKSSVALLSLKQIDLTNVENIAAQMISKVLNMELSDNIKDEFAYFADKLCNEELCSTSPWAKAEFTSTVWRIKEFITSMDNDFNTSKAVAILFDLASTIHKRINQNLKDNTGDLDLYKILAFETIILEKLATVLGFNLLISSEDSSQSEQNNQDLMQLILDIRKKVRDDKNWILSDFIRDKLTSLNIVVKDNKDGSSSWEFKN